ncbi:hypothetical protein [Flavobacterium sp.]|uniref:hypothetical protein n=1 Tax=Flavobacterium sp. TaxID=239 RepID=UPI0024896F56|nr:hypothetical protein [Flavobacterium sp.]MDI1317576.1 hypothetical protein [Flavobacterium sp.]
MKSKNLVLFFLPFIVLISCKKDVETKENVETPEIQNKHFVVTLDLIVKKNDNIHLYYTQDRSINFNEEQSLWAEVKGNNEVQQVVFKLPEDVIPTDFRLDLGYGKNVEQTEIIFKKFMINYYDRNFVASGAEIFNYFYNNKDNATVDKLTGTLKRLKVDQETAPSLYPQTSLEEELIKLTR